MTTNTDWLTSCVRYIKGLKTPTDSQHLLVQLYETQPRTSKQDRELAALARLERINEKADAARQSAHRILQDKRQRDRKEREHRLIQIGALVEIAGFDTIDRGMLLGGFLHLAEQLRGPHRDTIQQTFKLRGDTLLKQREEARQTKASALR
jgi:hypothetical protein